MRSNGSTKTASSSSVPAATCRDRTGTPICSIPTARVTSFTTASSRSAGTATANRAAMYDRGFDKPPELPQIREFDEVEQARAKGIDILSGYRHVDKLPASLRRRRHAAAPPFQDRQARPGLSFHGKSRYGRGVLSRHAGLHVDRRSALARPALLVFPLQYRTSLGRPVAA